MDFHMKIDVKLLSLIKKNGIAQMEDSDKSLILSMAWKIDDAPITH